MGVRSKNHHNVLSVCSFFLVFSALRSSIYSCIELFEPVTVKPVNSAILRNTRIFPSISECFHTNDNSGICRNLQVLLYKSIHQLAAVCTGTTIVPNEAIFVVVYARIFKDPRKASLTTGDTI